MKILNLLLIAVILIVSQGLNAQTNNPIVNDSIQYELKLSKSIFSKGESIVITVVSKNISNTAIKKWIDGGNYPIGAELKLKNSTGESMIQDYIPSKYQSPSLRLYTREEMEKMESTISPSGEFSKDYKLKSFVLLKKALTKGKYEMSYGNAKQIKFEIK